MITEYFVDLPQIIHRHKQDDPKRGEKIELALRNYFLSVADSVRLTNKVITLFKLGFPMVKQIGGPKDKIFHESLKVLESDFIKKTTDNELYFVEQGGNKTFDHYFYRLSPRIKDKIHKTWLFWLSDSPEFYGFEDPAFYQGDRLVGYVVSHETYVTLVLSDEDANKLEHQGVELLESKF